MNIDAFGRPVSIEFEGKETHKTGFGGCVTIFLVVCVQIYFFWRLHLYNSRERDEFFSSQYFSDFRNIQAYPLFFKDKDDSYASFDGISFTFAAYINDPQFDNDDSAYAKFKLHRYTNMKSQADIHDPLEPVQVKDEIIELTKCKSAYANSGWAQSKYYCPVFKEDDFLYGDYYSKKQQWYRLALHKCDIRERSKLGKGCADSLQIEKYF